MAERDQKPEDPRGRLVRLSRVTSFIALIVLFSLVLVDGRMMVIEYSDLPESAARRTDHDGELELWAGSIAVHVFDLAFLQRASLDASSLPFHRAHKAVSYIDGNGEQVVSTVPNAIKFERFIFDLMPSANNAIVVEADVDRVFAPLKNASGAAKDTPETTRAAIVRESKRMLEQAGISVADDVAVEINPRFAFDANELPAKVTDRAVSRDTYFTPLE